MPAPTAPNAELKTPLGTPTTPDEAHAIGRFLPPGLDGLRKMFAQTVERCDRDVAIMRAPQRWRPGQDDPESYLPGDVPAMRATLAGTNLNVAAVLFRKLGLARATSPELLDDVIEVVKLHVAAPMLVYQAAPFFVPGELARAASASDRPPAGLVEDLRLPFPSVWIVFGHDLELPAGMAWPEGTNFDIAPFVREMAGPAIGAWQRNIAGALHDRGGALCGVVLFAGPDGVGLADQVIWTLSANPDPGMPPPQHLDRQRGAIAGAVSRALLAPSVDNLALLVATTPWSDTPAVAPASARLAPSAGDARSSGPRPSGRSLAAPGPGGGSSRRGRRLASRMPRPPSRQSAPDGLCPHTLVEGTGGGPGWQPETRRARSSGTYTASTARTGATSGTGSPRRSSIPIGPAGRLRSGGSRCRQTRPPTTRARDNLKRSALTFPTSRLVGPSR